MSFQLLVLSINYHKISLLCHVLITVRDLEDCIGTGDIRKFYSVPARCAHKEDLVAACIEGLQQAAEDRTAACPTKKARLEREAAEAQQQQK